MICVTIVQSWFTLLLISALVDSDYNALKALLQGGLSHLDPCSLSWNIPPSPALMRIWLTIMRVFSFLTFYWLDCERDSLVKVMQSSLHKLLCVLFNWNTFTIAAWQVMYLTLNCRARLSLAAERVSVWASKFSAEPVSFQLMIFVVFICISWLFMLSSLLHLISFAHHRCRKKKRHPAYAIVFLVMIFTSRPSMLGLVRGISELYLVREWLWFIRYDLIESIASTVDSLPTVQ